MRGEADRGLAVRVLIDRSRVRILAGNELLGEWDRSQIGIAALHDGFLIRADGGEIGFRTRPAAPEHLDFEKVA